MAFARRRAEEFDAAVDGLTTPTDGRGGAAGPLRLASPELEPLVMVVRRMQALPTPAMRPDFDTELRSQLVSAYAERVQAEQPVTRPPLALAQVGTLERPRPRQRRLSVLAAAGVLAVTATGTAFASQSALPGDPLYPVKRSIEAVQLTLAGGGAGRGRELLQQAGIRLTETQALVTTRANEATTPRYVSTELGTFSSDARTGGRTLMHSYRTQADQTAVTDLRTYTSMFANRLSQLGRDLPRQSEPRFVAAAQLVTSLDTRARALCPNCSSLPPVHLAALLHALPGTGLPGVGPVLPTPGLLPGVTPTGIPGVPTLSGPGDPTLPTAPGSQPGVTDLPTQQPTGTQPAPTSGPGPSTGPTAPTVTVPTTPLPTTPQPTTPKPTAPTSTPTLTTPLPTTTSIPLPTTTLPTLPTTTLPSLPTTLPTTLPTLPTSLTPATLRNLRITPTLP